MDAARPSTRTVFGIHRGTASTAKKVETVTIVPGPQSGCPRASDPDWLPAGGLEQIHVMKQHSWGSQATYHSTESLWERANGSQRQTWDEVREFMQHRTPNVQLARELSLCMFMWRFGGRASRPHSLEPKVCHQSDLSDRSAGEHAFPICRTDKLHFDMVMSKGFFFSHVATPVAPGRPDKSSGSAPTASRPFLLRRLTAALRSKPVQVDSRSMRTPRRWGVLPRRARGHVALFVGVTFDGGPNDRKHAHELRE